MNYELHTFGCKVNTYDSGLVAKGLGEATLSTGPRVHVLNTCAVTAEATKEALKLSRKIKAKDPLAVVVVTGCGAQVDTERFEQLSAVDLIVANSHKGFLPQIIDDYFKGKRHERVFKSNIFRKEDLEPGGGIEENHTRAFLKIQDGCNSFCTYCVIPFARGKSRSLAISDLVRRVNELYQQGYLEVVLTGVHIADYEDPSLKGQLEDLVEALLLKTKMPRFRLTSLEPGEVSERLLELYQDERMCPHFHMSIQSATDSVLRSMKRRYDQASVQKSLHQIQKSVKNVFVGMDVIVGFPTESEELFDETYQVLAELPWTRLHVFPYSERPGTKAALLTESVLPAERKRRSSKLRELSLHRYQQELLKQVGTKKYVLPLRDQELGRGLSRDYWPVTMENFSGLQESKDVFQKEQSVEITSVDFAGELLGRVITSGSVG